MAIILFLVFGLVVGLVARLLVPGRDPIGLLGTILLGLAVDYGLVLYQESCCAPHLSARDVRLLLAPAIFWSALTTAGAFLTAFVLVDLPRLLV